MIYLLPVELDLIQNRAEVQMLRHPRQNRSEWAPQPTKHVMSLNASVMLPKSAPEAMKVQTCMCIYITHSVESGILEGHGPSPARKYIEFLLRNLILKHTVSKNDKLDSQRIICTVCTDADDPTVPADDLQEGVFAFAFRGCELWE